MEHLVRMGLLYDFYGGLLTPKQQRVFSLYYLDNFSLAEIAEEEGTTRQAVHDLLQRTETHLERWEEKLNLLQRFLREKEYVLEIKRALEQVAKLMPEDGPVSGDFSVLQQKVRELETFLDA